MRILLLVCLYFLVIVPRVQGAASIVPAFSKMSSAGLSVDAGKSGTNTMQIVGGVLSKPSGKPTLTITAASVGGASAAYVDAKAVTTVADSLSAVNATREYYVGSGGYASVAAAVTSLGSTKAVLMYKADQTLAANLSIPATLTLRPINGAIINQGVYDLTYLGSTIYFPISQVVSGTGAFVLNPAVVPTVYPEWKGAKADGSTVCRTSMAWAAATGIDVKFQTGTYFVGNIGYEGTLNQEYVMLVSGRNGQEFKGNNTVISINLTESASIGVWNVQNSKNIRWSGFKIVATGDDPFVGSEHGVAGIVLAGTSEISDLVASNMSIEHGLDFIQVQTTPASGSSKRISLSNINVKDCCYGFAFMDSGDNVTIKNSATDGVRRAYIAYGIKHHDVDLVIVNNLATSGTCMIKAYNYSISDIKLRVNFGTGSANGYIVVLEHQPDTPGTTVISDIDIDLIVADPAYQYQRVSFRSYLADGTLETATGNKWLRIKVHGALGTAIAGGSRMIAVDSTPGAYSTIALSAEILRLMSPINPNLNGFIIETPEKDIITYYGSASEAVASSLQIPYSIPDIANKGMWYRFTYTVIAESAGIAGQLTTSAEYIVYLYQANSSSAIVVGTPQKLYEVKTSTNPAIIAIASTGSTTQQGLVITFTSVGTEYNTTGSAYVKLSIARESWLGR